MLKLEEIKKQAVVSGIDAVNPVRIVATELVGENALTVYYKTIEGAVLERMLFRTDESDLFLAEAPCCSETAGGQETYSSGVEAEASAAR
jgi:hypothetical protein